MAFCGIAHSSMSTAIIIRGNLYMNNRKKKTKQITHYISMIYDNHATLSGNQWNEC